MFENDPERTLKLMGWGLHALGLALTAAAGLLLFSFVLAPLHEAADDYAIRSADLQKLLDNGPHVRDEHQRLAVAVAALRTRAEALQQRVPHEPDEAEFLAQLTTIATQEGLQVRDYRPGPVTRLETHSQMQIGLAAEGSYRSICGFLDRLATQSRLSRVEVLEIAAEPKTGKYPITTTLTIYFGAKQPPLPEEPALETTGRPAPGRAG